MEDIPKTLNLVLIGRTGAGKSSSGNTILGRRQAFISKKSPTSVTQEVSVQSGTVGNLSVNVYDTPGLYGTDINEEAIQQTLEKVPQTCESGPCVFLLVIKADTFTENEKENVEKIEKRLGEKHLKKTWILFTKGDELEEENMTIQEFLDGSEPLKKLVQNHDQRYHVFNNKAKENTVQVTNLLIKILHSYLDTLDVSEILNQNPLKRKPCEDIKPDTPADLLSSRRIVLLGKSGIGKSATGNTILGEKKFISTRRMNSVTSECSVEKATVSGRSVSVVDTPGFFDTEMKPEELAVEVAKSVYISSPGPHAFLIVLSVNGRYTEHEQQIPQIIELMFGQKVLKYSIILFTNGDQLEGKTIEELVKQNSKLRDLVQQCGGRYHVLNNKDQNNRDQVNDLLQKIDSMIEQNGGGHYSNQMFEDAERFRREEEQRQREEEERKQREKKQSKDEIDRVRKETEERVRAKIEEEQRQKEIKREERDRAKIEAGGKAADTSSGFIKFLNKHKRHFYLAAIAIGIAVGGAAVGGVAGAVVAKVIGGAVVKTAVAGAAVGGAAGAVAGAVVAKTADVGGAADVGEVATNAAGNNG